MNKELSPRAHRLLSTLSYGVAKKRGSAQILPEHLLLALIADPDSLAFEVLSYLKINVLMLQLALEQGAPQGNGLDPKHEISPSRRLRTIVDVANIESRIGRKNYVGTEHLLLAAVREENSIASRFFSAIPITIDNLRQAVEAVSLRSQSSYSKKQEEKE